MIRHTPISTVPDTLLPSTPLFLSCVTVKIRRWPLFLGPVPRRDPQRLARQPVIEPLERPRRRRQPGDRAVIERRRFARERPAIVERPATVALHLIRSEEHTSELQSLMRISYAVFCLKKKNKIQTPHIIQSPPR